MAITDTKEDWRSFPGAVLPVKGKDGRWRHEAWPAPGLRTASLVEVRAQCEEFCVIAFGSADPREDPVQAVRNLMEAGKAAAPLMSRDEIARMIHVLQEKMMSRARAK